MYDPEYLSLYLPFACRPVPYIWTPRPKSPKTRGKTEALVMMGALDVLHRLFGSDARAVAAARSAGLSALNAAGPLKRRLARHAMGGGSGA